MLNAATTSIAAAVPGVNFPMTAAALLLLAAALTLTLLHRRVLRQRDELRKLSAKLDKAQQSYANLAAFLPRFSRSINGEDGVDSAMLAMADYVCEKIDAESAAIFTRSAGKLHCAGVSGRYPLVHTQDPAVFDTNHQLLEALRSEKPGAEDEFPGAVFAAKQGELVPDAAHDPRFSGYPQLQRIGSVMAQPIVVDAQVEYVVCAVNNRRHPGRPFSEEQFEELGRLAPEVEVAQKLAQAYAEASRRDRIDQELEFARHLQQSLLPPAFPQWEQFSITARTRSAKEVNGDFYDFIRIDADRVLVIIGDACGKGIPACMLSSMTRSFARSLVDNFTTLTQFLRDINTKLYRDTDADRFITLGCCLLDRRNSLLEFGRAGHTDMVSFVHNHIRVLAPDGVALGILPPEYVAYDTLCIAVDPGTSVMLYSDGLTEALGVNSEEFGPERLCRTFSDACTRCKTPNEIMSFVMSTVAEYELEQSDDQTLVLIRRIEDAGE